MTKIINNPLLKGASGKLGDVVIYKRWQGQVLMTNKLSGRKVISEKQKASSEKFLMAANYAKKQMTMPEVKAEYATSKTLNKNAPYRVALTDYLKPPVVHYVRAIGYSGAIGDDISIKAIDDFKVVKVRVIISNGAGIELEQGEAKQNPKKKYMWHYKTTVVNKNLSGTVIKVTAFDRPDNEGNGELVIGGSDPAM